MCLPEYPIYCSDTVALKGYLAIMSEYLLLQKDVRLKYINDTNRAIVFNTDDYKRTGIFISQGEIVRLYYDYVRPGFLYFYNLLINELDGQNKNVGTTLKGYMTAMIVVSVLFLLFLWIPYIQDAKRQVCSIAIYICVLDEETAIAAVVHPGERHIQCEGPARVLHQHHLHSQVLSPTIV